MRIDSATPSSIPADSRSSNAARTAMFSMPTGTSVSSSPWSASACTRTVTESSAASLARTSSQSPTAW
ncbi:hypothetical protein [Solicola gregarius]|uniref:Uncharacterized protein n=1 Tax=Solicola gregarius TaxID=2908642 RepID=A0AA46YL65_9ACTN|nr:hypothetical protein [Solicola gregarius]UYM06585.1 hypothetical protein L0C25_05805 [Solicola gregarius]